MSPTAQKIADHYVELLSTLNYEMKLSIINSLSASLLDDVSRTASKKKIRSFGMAKGKCCWIKNESCLLKNTVKSKDKED